MELMLAVAIMGVLSALAVPSFSLIVNRSDNYSLANTISGSGTLTQAGTGTTTVTGVNAYTGGTVLHLYMTEPLSSADACRSLVKRALSRFRLPYITVTPTFSICPRKKPR